MSKHKLVFGSAAQNKRNDIIKSYKNIGYQVLNSLDFDVSRSPESGQIHKNGYYVIAYDYTITGLNFSFIVIYKFNNTSVMVFDIQCDVMKA
jgi:hypothetical protein